MPLSCSCDYSGDAEWWWYRPDDYSTFPQRRAARCRSCKALIRAGDICTIFLRERIPNGYLEERIYGDEVPLAPWYHCETCADLYFSLDELGFCVRPDEDMLELVKEYHKEFGPQAAGGGALRVLLGAWRGGRAHGPQTEGGEG